MGMCQNNRKWFCCLIPDIITVWGFQVPRGNKIHKYMAPEYQNILGCSENVNIVYKFRKRHGTTNGGIRKTDNGKETRKNGKRIGKIEQRENTRNKKKQK